MNKVLVFVVAIALLCLSIAAQADVFNLGTAPDGTVLTNLETVTVGDPGNAADTRSSSPAYGSVAYTYSIGKYEVTAAQYCDFLNAKAKTYKYGLYNSNMIYQAYSYWLGCNIQCSGSSGNYTYSVASDWANRPVNLVSFWDACRFVNWLNNGQGDGDTETGAYTLNGYNNDYNSTISRNAGAKWFLPSEYEWYKAAYYKGGGTNAGYWDYATQSNTAPSNQVLSTDPGNSANYYIDGYSVGKPYYRTSVGEFENSASPYGTFDQCGNVLEWNEDVTVVDGFSYAFRRLRGGDFYDSASLTSTSIVSPPTKEYSKVGFRVAYMPDGWQPVPEPSSLIALTGGLVSLLGIRRRRA